MKLKRLSPEDVYPKIYFGISNNGETKVTVTTTEDVPSRVYDLQQIGFKDLKSLQKYYRNIIKKTNSN
jgi:hypothetical protein